jgi:UDP-glucuronate 4-epimerase
MAQAGSSNSENDMKILITGGAGFIGSHLAERYLAKNHEVLVLDNFDTFYDPAIKRLNVEAALTHPRYRLVEGDIRDAECVESTIASFGPNLIVHLAARAGVRPSIELPLLYQDVNVGGTQVILEAARKADVRRIVFASSSSVYGNDSKVPFSEKDPVMHPVSPYAATKRAGELLGYTYWHLHQIEFCALRFFTVYGPRQRPEMAIHKFTRLIDEGREIPQFGDGSSRRDYTWIEDIVDGIEAAAAKFQGFEIFNLGESKTTSLADLIALISRAAGKPARIQSMPFQPGDVEATYADISHARARIGYAPRCPVEEGIPRFVEWYVSHRAPRS